MYYRLFFSATVVITFGFGFIASACIEWPFVGICKLLFSPSLPNRAPIEVAPSITPDGTLPEYSYGSSTEPEKQWPVETEMAERSDIEKKKENESFNNAGFEEEKSDLTKYSSPKDVIQTVM